MVLTLLLLAVSIAVAPILSVVRRCAVVRGAESFGLANQGYAPGLIHDFNGAVEVAPFQLGEHLRDSFVVESNVHKVLPFT